VQTEAALSSKTSALRRLAAINLLSFAAQIVQIGTVPPTLALELQASGNSPVLIGAVAAAPWVVILAVSQGVPRQLRRHGFIAMTLIGLVTSVLAVLGMMLTRSGVLLLAFNGLLGLGLIVRWIACDTWIVAVSGAPSRGRAIGIHETLMGCGIAAGPLILAGTHGSAASSFAICLALLVGSAAVTLALKPGEPPPRPRDASPHAPVPSGLGTAVLGGGLSGAVETASISFVPLLAAHGHGRLDATGALFAFGLGGTLLQLPLGLLADRFGYARIQLATAGALLLAAAAVALAPAGGIVPALLLFVWGGTAGGMNTLAVIEAGHSQHETARAMTWIALAYTAGSIVGPLLTGVTVAYLPRAGLSLVIAAAAMLFILLRRRSSS
jgi:MFS family permease